MITGSPAGSTRTLEESDRPSTAGPAVGAPALGSNHGGVQAEVRRRPSSRHAASLALAWPTLLLFSLQRVIAVAVLAGLAGGHWVDGLMHWDATWYRQIAEEGYSAWPMYGPTGQQVNTNLAFFPLFPMAGRLLASLTPLGVSGSLLLLAWIGSVVGAWGVFAVGNHLGGRWMGMALALAWGASPQAMVLVMGYPEGWLTAALAFAILFLLTDRPIAAGVACIVAGLLQPSAVPLIGIIVLWGLVQAVRSMRAGNRPSTWLRYVFGAALAPMGFLGVMAAVAIRTAHPLGYFTVQAEWNSTIGSPLTTLASMQNIVFPPDGNRSLMALYVPVIIGYLVLLALLVGQLNQGLPRHFPWVVAYAALATLLVLANQNYFNSIPRHFLPVFVLLIPLARLRSSWVGAGLALALATAASVWWGANFVVHSPFSI